MGVYAVSICISCSLENEVSRLAWRQIGNLYFTSSSFFFFSDHSSRAAQSFIAGFELSVGPPGHRVNVLISVPFGTPSEPSAPMRPIQVRLERRSLFYFCRRENQILDQSEEIHRRTQVS